MNARSRICIALAALAMAGGCVVGDQLTTITICSDGSADLLVMRSNLRSTQQGDDGQKEIADYKTRFDARTEDEFTRIREAGGTAVDGSWVQPEEPLANFVRAHLPTASALEKYGTLKNEDESLRVETQFHLDGSRRRLTVRISVAPALVNAAQVSPSNAEQCRQASANGISETRIAVTGGSITAARGFTVAADKQSALLDGSAIDAVIRTGGDSELFLEWEVTR
jgi:hypothetical protein